MNIWDCLNFSVNVDNVFQTALDSTIRQHLYSPLKILTTRTRRPYKGQALFKNIPCIDCDPVVTNPHQHHSSLGFDMINNIIDGWFASLTTSTFKGVIKTLIVCQLAG